MVKTLTMNVKSINCLDKIFDKKSYSFYQATLESNNSDEINYLIPNELIDEITLDSSVNVTFTDEIKVDSEDSHTSVRVAGIFRDKFNKICITFINDILGTNHELKTHDKEFIQMCKMGKPILITLE